MDSTQNTSPVTGQPGLNSSEKASLADITVERGQTQKNVNRRVLEYLVAKFPKATPLEALDLPCGQAAFLHYLQALFPAARLYGADIMRPPHREGIHFTQMDLTKDFTLPAEASFDLVTSISGVMMFGNTLQFIENCSRRLKKRGTLILTNDNPATIMDRMAYLLLARYRLFKPVFEDSELLTQYVPVQELCRLLRRNGISIEKIEYTSFYPKDLIYLPFALLVYPLQLLYLLRYKTGLPQALKWQMYPFSHLFCKHYIIYGRKEA